MEPVAQKMRPAFVRYGCGLCRVLVVSVLCCGPVSLAWADDAPASGQHSGPITLSDIGDAFGWLDNQLDKAIAASDLDKEVVEAQETPPATLHPEHSVVVETTDVEVTPSETSSPLPEVVEGIGDALGWLDRQLDVAIAASEGSVDEDTKPVTRTVVQAPDKAAEDVPHHAVPKEDGVPLMERAHPLVLTKSMAAKPAQASVAQGLLVQEFSDPVAEEDTGVNFTDLLTPDIRKKTAGTKSDPAPSKNVAETKEATPLVQSASRPE